MSWFASANRNSPTVAHLKITRRKNDVYVGIREIIGLLNHFPNGVGACNVAAAAKVQIKFHQLCVATFTSQMKTTRTVFIDTGAHTLHFVQSFFVY